MKKNMKRTVKIVVTFMVTILLFISSLSEIVAAGSLKNTIKNDIAITTVEELEAWRLSKSVEIINKNVVTTTPVTTNKITTITTTITTVKITKKNNKNFIYKPETHYVHTKDCYWTKTGIIEKINNTKNIEARLCDECNPDIKIYNEYIEPTEVINYTEESVTQANITGEENGVYDDCSVTYDSDYVLLCKIVASEYSGMSSTIERAKIVAAVMNRVQRFGGTIESCLYESCVPWGFNPNQEYFGGVHYSEMADAVDYYFFYGTQGFYDSGYWEDGADSWWGDGSYNHFYMA